MASREHSPKRGSPALRVHAAAGARPEADGGCPLSRLKESTRARGVPAGSDRCQCLEVQHFGDAPEGGKLAIRANALEAQAGSPTAWEGP